jgi:hypothetical protein
MWMTSLRVRWLLASMVVPVMLGGGSWLTYQAGFGFLSEGLAGPFFFSAPFAPFLARAYFGPHGAGVVWPSVLAVTGNWLVYGLGAALHRRWLGLPRVDRLLRLVPSFGGVLLVLLAVSSIVAFGR